MTDDSINVAITDDSRSGQIEALQDELDYSQHEAERAYDAVREQAKAMASEQGRDWSDKMLDDMANVLIDTHIQVRNDAEGRGIEDDALQDLLDDLGTIPREYRPT